MYTVEEIKEKIGSGQWTRADVDTIIADLKASSKLTSHVGEIYYSSYGVFAYSFRDRVYPMLEICQEAKLLLGPSMEKALIYLALMRLYFCLGFLPKVVEYGLKYADSGPIFRESMDCIRHFYF